MANIGFLSYWGIGRGLSYVTLCYVKMLQDSGHKVFILKQGLNDIQEEYKTVDVHVTEHKDYIVPREIFKKWLLDNNIFSKILIAYKSKEGRKIVVKYKEFQNE